jgi:ACR3 family arsenite transporter
MKVLGRPRFERRFLPVFSKITLLGLLYTIVIIFAYQAKRILHNLGPVFRVFAPMCLYFFIMWLSTFSLCLWLTKRKAGASVFGYEMAVTQSFTAGSNNFVSANFSIGRS